LEVALQLRRRLDRVVDSFGPPSAGARRGHVVGQVVEKQNAARLASRGGFERPVNRRIGLGEVKQVGSKVGFQSQDRRVPGSLG
jgi:hypothetical protein